MKLTIDTELKTVTVHEPVSFKEIETIKKFIGEGWKEWKFSCQYETQPFWYQPYTIPATSTPFTWTAPLPDTYPTITCDAGAPATSGTFFLKVQ